MVGAKRDGEIMVSIGGGHPEDMTTDDLQVRPGKSEPPHPLPCSWNVCSAHVFHRGGHFQRCSLERAIVVEII